MEAVESGADGYIIQPFNTSLMLESIELALAKARRRTVSA